MAKFIFTKKLYTPALLEENLDCLFVFGDNLEGIGHGGQAVIRDEPNAFGIPTKDSPEKYMTDKSFRTYKKYLDVVFEELEDALKNSGSIRAVVVPIDFIGTGLADLPNTSPHAMVYLMMRFNVLMNLYGVQQDDLVDTVS